MGPAPSHIVEHVPTPSHVVKRVPALPPNTYLSYGETKEEAVNALNAGLRYHYACQLCHREPLHIHIGTECERALKTLECDVQGVRVHAAGWWEINSTPHVPRSYRLEGYGSTMRSAIINLNTILKMCGLSIEKHNDIDHVVCTINAKESHLAIRCLQRTYRGSDAYCVFAGARDEQRGARFHFPSQPNCHT